MKQYHVIAEWTGKYPNKCSGEWIIFVNGKRIAGLGNDCMQTFGTYLTWHFENWSEVWEEYEDGMSVDQWIINPPNNIKMQLRLAGFDPKDENLLSQIYHEVNKLDWRHNSCGGCI